MLVLFRKTSGEVSVISPFFIFKKTIQTSRISISRIKRRMIRSKLQDIITNTKSKIKIDIGRSLAINAQREYFLTKSRQGKHIWKPLQRRTWSLAIKQSRDNAPKSHFPTVQFFISYKRRTKNLKKSAKVHNRYIHIHLHSSILL
jgi:hypothetical protein